MIKLIYKIEGVERKIATTIRAMATIGEVLTDIGQPEALGLFAGDVELARDGVAGVLIDSATIHTIRLRPFPSGGFEVDRPYIIRSMLDPTRVVTAVPNGRTLNAGIHSVSATGGANQLWIFQADGRIRSAESGLVLEARNVHAPRWSHDLDVRLAVVREVDKQKWSYDVDQMTISLVGAARQLTAVADTSAVGPDIIAWVADGGVNRRQRWALELA